MFAGPNGPEKSTLKAVLAPERVFTLIRTNWSRRFVSGIVSICEHVE